MADNDNTAFQKSIDDATLQILLEVEKNMKKACVALQGQAKAELKDASDTGVLRASILYDVEFTPEAITGYVGSGLKYAPFVHQGTGIYAINGDGRKTPWVYKAEDGKYKGFHTTVGQKPNPFLDRARNKAMNRIEKLLGGKN